METKEQQDTTVTPTERISRSVIHLRGERVILDRELAAIYGVSTKRLNEQVRRNIERFPPDFMFQLTDEEAKSLRSQFATLDAGRGRYTKYQPCAFTEHGAVQAANVLNSPHAIAMGIYVVRVFVQLRQFASSHTVSSDICSARIQVCPNHVRMTGFGRPLGLIEGRAGQLRLPGFTTILLLTAALPTG
jgi:hypothetical protein